VAILVSCECGGEFLTDDGNAGRKTQCLACRQVLTVSTDEFTHPNSRIGRLDQAPFSGRAIASLVLGGLSLGLSFLAGLPAIGLGIAGIADIRRSRGRLRGDWLAMAGIALGVVGSTVMTGFWIATTVRAIQETKHRNECSQNLKDIYTALLTHLRSHDTLPSRAIFDRQGRPLLSWRVAILPLLGAEGKALYSKFDLKEPWDSPHNRALLAEMPAVFRCGGGSDSRQGVTHYQLIVGPGTVFDGQQSRRWDDLFGRGPRKFTPHLIIEADAAVPWTAPVDAADDPDDPLTMRGVNHAGWYHVLEMNGSLTIHERPSPDSTALAVPSSVSKSTPKR
jgi:Protein of unknown function (DUF1559)/Domain of unknown function (DUF4190)